MSLPKDTDLLNKINTKDTDQNLSEKIDSVTSEIFPDSNLKVNEDLQNIKEEDNTELSLINEKDQDEQYMEVASLIPKNIFKKKPKPNEDGTTIKDLQDQQADILKTKVDEKKLFEVDGNQIVFRDFEQPELDELNKLFLNMDTEELAKNFKVETIYKNKGSNINDIGQIVTKTFKKQIEAFKTGPTTVQDILNLASKYGLNETYAKILNAPEGMPLPKELVAAGMIQVRVLGLHLDKLVAKAANGTASEADLINLRKTFVMYGATMGKINAAISESATTLALVRHIDLERIDMGDLEMLWKKLGNDMTPEQWKAFGSHFAQLDIHQKSAFIKQTWMSKLGDAWAEAWINTRLMSPITHTVNVVGNLSFNALKIVEYGIAAGINKIPGLSHRDGVMFNEVWAMITSLNKGTKLAIGNGYKVLKTGDPITSKTNKMDLRNEGKSITRDLLPEGHQNNIFGMGIDYLGSAFRFPGRLLLAEDEAMKGIIFHMELDRLATKRYNAAIADGVSKDEAMKLYKSTLANPDKAAVTEIKEAMLEGTFQSKLPAGWLSDAQKWLNIPAMKMFVPFYKTVVNIGLETNKRNPMLAFFMPSMRKALSGADGPAKKQLAMAKIMAGGSLMMTFGAMAYGSAPGQKFMITGQAPYNKAEREAFYRKGFQPYSIAVLNEETGLYESTSYARFEPISALLAISADMSYYMSRPDHYGNNQWDAQASEIMFAAIASIVPYLSSQPFAKGLADLGAIFQPGYGEAAGMSTRGTNMLLSKILESTMGVAGNPFGTFGAYLQRMQDPKMYETMITTEQAEKGFPVFGWGARENNDQDIPQWIKTFYKIYNKTALDSPFFNPNLEQRVNLYGEPLVGPEQNVFSPIRTQNEKYNIVDSWLVKLNLGIRMPDARIGGIDLSAEEYTQFIKFINLPNEEGLTMLDEMKMMVQDPEWLAQKANPGLQLDALKDILRRRKITATLMMKEKYKHIQKGIDIIEEKRLKKGKV